MKRLILVAAILLAGCGNSADREDGYLKQKLALAEQCEATRKVAYYFSVKGDKVQEKVWTERGDKQCALSEAY